MADTANWPIAQNCIMMFQNTDVKAFIMRVVILILTTSTYPLLNYFFTSGVLKMWREHCKSSSDYIYLNINELSDEQMVGSSNYNKLIVSSLIIPLAITIFYPQIAGVLGYVGSFSGLFIVYFLPILTYLTKLKNDSENPLLADANLIHQDYLLKKQYSSQKKKEGLTSIDLSSEDNSIKVQQRMIDFVLENKD